MPFLNLLIDWSASLFRPGLWRSLLGLTVLLTLVGGVAAWRQLPDSNDAPAVAEPVRHVRVAAVRFEQGSERLRLPGLLRAADSAELAFIHPGHLAERRVVRGERVSAGQVLALLNNPGLSPALSAAEANLAELRAALQQAQREWQRLADLHQRGLVSTEELERAQTRREQLIQSEAQALARREEASEQLAEASLRAPFAGTVVDVWVETGEFVSAGQPVLALAGHGGLEVALEISPRRAHALRVGQTAQVLEADQAVVVTASLIELGMAGPGRPAPVRLRIEEAPVNWQPGMGVQVELTLAQTARLTIPLQAVVDPGSGQPRVFRIAQDRAERVEVVLGAVHAGRVAVAGDLNAGDQLVVAGQSQLLNGERVRVLP